MAKYKGFVDVLLFGSVRRKPFHRSLTPKTGVRVPLGTPIFPLLAIFENTLHRGDQR